MPSPHNHFSSWWSYFLKFCAELEWAINSNLPISNTLFNIEKLFKAQYSCFPWIYYNIQLLLWPLCTGEFCLINSRHIKHLLLKHFKCVSIFTRNNWILMAKEFFTCWLISFYYQMDWCLYFVSYCYLSSLDFIFSNVWYIG